MSFTQFAQEKDAASFRTAFQDAIESAVADELEQQKLAIAQSMFGSNVEEDAAEEEEEEPVDALAEESEQIDEIKKETLSSYVGKAMAQSNRKKATAMQLLKKGGDPNRLDMAAKHLNKAVKRRHGVEKAVDKLSGGAKVMAKEEVDQIDEVSPPGREKQVKALKKTGVRNPWAVAWASYNKSKKK